jgi:hypothetical protein
MKKLLLVLITAALPTIATAGELWGAVNLTSYHTKPEQKLNTNNIGAGLEYHYAPTVLFMGGAFRNSYDNTSTYLLAGWTPLEIGSYIKIGAVAGAINGYPGLNNGGVTKAIAGLIRIEGETVGANIVIIPPALKSSPVTFGLQVKFKF